MRTGWKDKEAAPILRVRERKVSQSYVPALEKIARLYRANPHKTMQDILDMVNNLEPMSDEEISAREAMLTGRADRHR